MRHLFVEPEALRGDPVVVEGADCHHLANVLRVRVGERMHLLDGVGGSWEAEVAEVGRRQVTLRRVSPLPPPPEPARRIVIAQALGKGDRFEEAIQHATEAGASAFIPLVTERGVPRLDAADWERKAERWRRVLKGAAEQSFRASVPELHAQGTVREVAERCAAEGAVFVLHADGLPLADALAEAGPERPVVFLIGPEGGFTDTEVADATSAGAQAVSLGPFILRTETAGVFAVAQTLFACRPAAPVLESSHSTP